VTAVIAVGIQLDLMILTVASASYRTLRDNIGFDPKPYGLPRYLAGSILLSRGVVNGLPLDALAILAELKCQVLASTCNASSAMQSSDSASSFLSTHAP
jgi:hypothetical protein